jgi:hypothetical protein
MAVSHVIAACMTVIVGKRALLQSGKHERGIVKLYGPELCVGCLCVSVVIEIIEPFQPGYPGLVCCLKGTTSIPEYMSSLLILFSYTFDMTLSVLCTAICRRQDFLVKALGVIPLSLGLRILAGVPLNRSKFTGACTSLPLSPQCFRPVHFFHLFLL